MTDRTAYVTVRNGNSSPIMGVSVVHKYSNDFKDNFQWGGLKAWEIASQNMTVRYRTGFGTTGKDWWIVTWFSHDLKTLYFSDPQNFRSTFDYLDKVAPSEITTLVGQYASTAATEGGPVASLAAKLAAEEAAKQVTSMLFNSETTDGFKQHILREEDEWQVTQINIEGSTITFKSPSGDSETGFSSKQVPVKSVPVAEVQKTLFANQSIEKGYEMTAMNNSVRLVLQADGNLVLYNRSQTPVWATKTAPRSDVARATMQDDGNFVLYSASNQPLWSSNTYNNRGAKLLVQNDGNVVIYAADGRALWATNTS